MAVRAKFKVQGTTNNVVMLTAVTADEVEENQRFHKYTPWGEIRIAVDNPVALGFFMPGKTVYVDFTEAK